jgi:hypothetical protein
MKTYWVEWLCRANILDLGTRWRCVISFTHQPHYRQGKSPRLCGSQSRSELCGVNTNPLPLSEIEPLFSP